MTNTSPGGYGGRKESSMKHDYIILVTFEGKAYAPVIRKTEDGVNAYTNHIYHRFCDRYGEKRTTRSLTVEYGYFLGIIWVPCGTWHA